MKAVDETAPPYSTEGGLLPGESSIVNAPEPSPFVFNSQEPKGDLKVAQSLTVRHKLSHLALTGCSVYTPLDNSASSSSAAAAHHTGCRHLIRLMHSAVWQREGEN